MVKITHNSQDKGTPRDLPKGEKGREPDKPQGDWGKDGLRMEVSAIGRIKIQTGEAQAHLGTMKRKPPTIAQQKKMSLPLARRRKIRLWKELKKNSLSM